MIHTLAIVRRFALDSVTQLHDATLALLSGVSRVCVWIFVGAMLHPRGRPACWKRRYAPHPGVPWYQRQRAHPHPPLFCRCCCAYLTRYGFLSESTWPDRVLRKFWPDGTPYDPANPETPAHLITYDEVSYTTRLCSRSSENLRD